MKRRSFLGMTNNESSSTPSPFSAFMPRDPLPTLSLAPKPGTLTDAEIRHVYRRTGFGVSVAQLEAARGKSAEQLVTEILDSVAISGQPDPPSWMGDFNSSPSKRRHRDMRGEQILRMLDHPIVEKLVLCWMNHFVAYTAKVPQHQWQHLRKLREHCIGDFKAMTLEMGIDNAMLLYLDGRGNREGKVNENYARELVELFTTGRQDLDGVPNYGEEDIGELARALTGWVQVEKQAESKGAFNPGRFDDGPKTIFGVTANFDHDSVVDLIFTEKADKVAENICRMLYTFFVYELPNVDIVRELAATFQSNNWNLRPVLAQLLKSRHFFQAEAIGTKIKSPLETFVGLLREADMEINPELSTTPGTGPQVRIASEAAGQDLVELPDVRGWTEHRTWITVDALPRRGGSAADFIYGSNKYRLPEQDMVNWTKGLVADQGDPVEIVDNIIEHLLTAKPNAAKLDELLEVFKGDVPDSDYENGLWSLDEESAPEQLRNLVEAIVRLPHYQLG